MVSHYIIQGIFALAGLTSLLAALLDWDWFFTARNAQFVVRKETSTLVLRGIGHDTHRDGGVLLYTYCLTVIIGMCQNGKGQSFRR